jgi:hypothetical protein
MFSTMESGATRVMRVRLEKREGEKILTLPVQLPSEMRPVVVGLIQRPTERTASDFAVLLSNLVWLEAPELDAIYAMPPSSLASLALSSGLNGQSAPVLREVMRKPRSWIQGLKSSSQFGQGRPIDFDSTAIEVWQLTFDRAARSLSVRPLVDATEPRRRHAPVGAS